MTMQAFDRPNLLLFAFTGTVSACSTTYTPASPTPAYSATPRPASGTLDSTEGNPASREPIDMQFVVGLWKSNFGPVKIVRDTAGPSDALMGVWVYDRGGQEVIGFFSGRMNGNVLQFTWDEPSTQQGLLGSGYLEFDTKNHNYTGLWWTESRDRSGEWNGWRELSENVEEGVGPFPLGDGGNPEASSDPRHAIDPAESLDDYGWPNRAEQ